MHDWCTVRLASGDFVLASAERAAIFEYDCGLPRDEGERLARIKSSGTIH